MNLERALAKSKVTMPKCSGPTCWTRGWLTPCGFCRKCGEWERERLRVRVTAIGTTSKKGDKGSPILFAGSPEGYSFSRKPTDKRSYNKHRLGVASLSMAV